MEKISRFRIIAFMEGISFLVLLFIAMPMKYFFEIPIATKIVGSMHGVLFVLFCIFLYDAARSNAWIYKFRTFAFISSFVPFGMIWLDKKLQNPSLISIRD